MSRGMSEFERLTTYIQDYKTKSKYKVFTVKLEKLLILIDFDRKLAIPCNNVQIYLLNIELGVCIFGRLMC